LAGREAASALRRVPQDRSDVSLKTVLAKSPFTLRVSIVDRASSRRFRPEISRGDGKTAKYEVIANAANSIRATMKISTDRIIDYTS
jgi:hypothetical protein